MNLQDFIADVQAKAKAAEDAISAFFAAHPEIEQEAASAATEAVGAVTVAAQAEVTAQTSTVPPEVGDALDIAITAAKQAATDQITAIQADTDAKVAKLEAAKAQVAPV